MRTYREAEDKFNRKLGSTIKDLREKQNVTQQKLANELNIAISTYRQKEKGESFFTSYELVFIVRLLRKRLDEVIKSL